MPKTLSTLISLLATFSKLLGRLGLGVRDGLAACGLLADADHLKPIIENMVNLQMSRMPCGTAKLAPLFEVEGHASRVALIPQAARPIRVQRAGMGAAFAADDYPI